MKKFFALALVALFAVATLNAQPQPLTMANYATNNFFLEAWCPAEFVTPDGNVNLGDHWIPSTADLTLTTEKLEWYLIGNAYGQNSDFTAMFQAPNMTGTLYKGTHEVEGEVANVTLDVSFLRTYKIRNGVDYCAQGDNAWTTINNMLTCKVDPQTWCTGEAHFIVEAENIAIGADAYPGKYTWTFGVKVDENIF